MGQDRPLWWIEAIRTSENTPYRESVNKGKEKGRGEKPQP